MKKWNSYKAFVWAIGMLLIMFSLFTSLWMLVFGIGHSGISFILIWTLWLLIALKLAPPNFASNTKPIIERDKTQTDPQKGPLSQ